MSTPLEDLAEELREADRQDRVEMLIDLAKNLPALPEKYERLKDAAHRVEECQSPVFLFIEVVGDKVALFIDAPIEAPTVRGFVALLVEGLADATVQEIVDIPNDLVERAGLLEILGMLRVRGLHGVLRRLKAEVVRAAARAAATS